MKLPQPPSTAALRARAASHHALAACCLAEAEVRSTFPEGSRVIVYGKWLGRVKYQVAPVFDYLAVTPDDPDNDEVKYMVRGDGYATVKLDCVDVAPAAALERMEEQVR